MSFQWILIEYCLYVEVFCVSLLLIPFISAQRWRSLFNLVKHKRLGRVCEYASFLFYFIVLLLCIFFITSMWTTWRLGVSKGHVGDKNRDKLKMRLFKAQRNLYVTGFTLFLLLVLGRLVSLLTELGGLSYKIKESSVTQKKDN